MNNKITISVDISSSDFETPLGLEIWIDDFLIANLEHVKESTTLHHEISDDDGEHELHLVLKNKNADHTHIDENGLIVKDAVLTINSLKFDDIDLNQLFYDHAVYTHDFNGSSQQIQEKFYGTMGCNGTVSLKFTTPMYLWLLENI